MKILVINSGSSSVKYQVFNMSEQETENWIAKGIVEKIGTNFARLKLKTQKNKSFEKTAEILDHKEAITRILNTIIEPEHAILDSIEDIVVVGHRVVHGGESFSGSVMIDHEIMNALKECISLAPLHNPPNIRGIEACQELLPKVPQVGVFDTAFHQTMPEHAFIYGLPYVLYQNHKIRRYGFHGTSHQYAAHEAAEYLKRDIAYLKIITCHLGNGASIAAISGGKSIDTSMGFTPLEGLVMGTRCGDLDPAIIPFLIQKDSLTLRGINNLMNKHSGVYGIAGLETGDMRDLEIAEEEGHQRAKLARDIFAYRVKKYIGGYAAALGGVDVLVFTGGIGENDHLIRARSVEGLEFLGIEIDPDKNVIRGETFISKGKIPVLVIKADEELVIAREARRLISKRYQEAG